MGERADIDAIFAEIDRKEAEAAAMMPDTAAALRVMFSAYSRLQKLGWRPIMYAPKERLEQTVSVGSTGIHPAVWMMDRWWIEEAHDLWPGDPILYKPSKEELDRMSEKKRAAVLAAYPQGGNDDH